MQVEVAGREVRITNPEKVWYPETGTTKADVLAYYADIAPWVLPHIRMRPLNLKRYPDGVEGEAFYQKECPEHRPDWLPTAPMPHRDRPGRTNHCAVDDLAGLLWIVNTGDLELHPLLCRADDVDTPLEVVFDLDPGTDVGLAQCCALGLRLRDVLRSVGLEAFPNVAGSKGLHIHVPLHTPTSFEASKAFARGVADLLAGEDPKGVTSNMSKEVRRGRVFVDWSQNSRHKSTVAPYSLRGKARPMVAAPVTWAEVETGQHAPEHLVFLPADVLRRAREDVAPFGAAAAMRQRLPM